MLVSEDYILYPDGSVGYVLNVRVKTYRSIYQRGQKLPLLYDNEDRKIDGMDGLNMKCLPQAHMLKPWSLMGGVSFGGFGNFRKWDLGWVTSSLGVGPWCCVFL
jgi:hypothetical protein